VQRFKDKRLTRSGVVFVFQLNLRGVCHRAVMEEHAFECPLRMCVSVRVVGLEQSVQVGL